LSGILSIKRALADVDEDFKEFAPMLGIKRGMQTLTGWFEESAETGALSRGGLQPIRPTQPQSNNDR